jgi:hypothetical protein
MSDWENPTWLDEIYELAGRLDLTKVRVDGVTVNSRARGNDKSASRYIGQITIKGRLLASTTNARRADYDQVVSSFIREGYYSIETAQSKFEDTNFTLVVDVARRAPSEYKTRLDDPTIVKDKTKSSDKTKDGSPSKSPAPSGAEEPNDDIP